MLNSFWDKFGERVNKPTAVTVQDPSHLFTLISDLALGIRTLRLCTDDILERDQDQYFRGDFHHLSCSA